MIPRQASPTRAKRYFTTGLTKHAPKGDQVPALIWLWIAIAAVIFIRERRLPGIGEAITLAIAGGIIVGIGNFAPHLVTLFLIALLLAGILGAAPQVANVLALAQAQLDALTPSGLPGAGGGARKP